MIFHGPCQIHQIINVDRILFRLLERDVESSLSVGTHLNLNLVRVYQLHHLICVGLLIVRMVVFFVLHVIFREVQMLRVAQKTVRACHVQTANVAKGLKGRLKTPTTVGYLNASRAAAGQDALRQCFCECQLN
jgi:hypothetical protein